MLDLSRQFAGIRAEVMVALEAVCDSQRLILGPEVGRFEAAAAAACGATYAIGCGSGTDALWLAMAAAGVGPGDAVITSPFSFFATVSAILRCGARPLLADIDPATYNICPQSVEALAEQSRSDGVRVRAVLPVHLYGQCADMDALGAICKMHDLLLIEDAAQAFGASWRGVPAGALGDAAAFSFYPTKNLSAMGEAGMVTTSAAATDDRCRSLRAHGMRRRYFHDEVGWNSRLDTMQAAILEVKLRYVTGWNERRRAVAARYDELFRSAGLASEAEGGQAPQAVAGVVLPITDERATHVFHQYVVRAPRRDQLRQHLVERGIGSEVYYPVPLHLQVALRDLGYRSGDFPVSEVAAAEVLALPIYPELRPDEQERVVDGVRSFYA